MFTRIAFETKRELLPQEQQELLRFRGILIQRGYTDIIHLADKFPDLHIHFFDVARERAPGVITFIREYLDERCWSWCLFQDR